MTHPQYAPPAQPGYPPQAPQYPPAPEQQYAQPPAAPAAPAYPPQYAPPAQPGYPPQPGYGYGPQAPAYGYPPAPPAPPVPAGPPPSLDGFYSQPAVGWGKAWSWKDKPLGTTYAGVVARPLTNADVEQQTTTGQNGVRAPQTYRDGRAVLVMKVPMHVQPSPEHPEGRALWYCQGQARDELNRAMAEAGAPEGPPEAGAIVVVAAVSERRNTYGTMSKQFKIQYTRPQGAAPAAPAAPQAPAQPPAPAAPAQQYVAPPQTGVPVSAPPPPTPVQAPPPAVPPQAPAQPAAPVPPAPGATGELDPERAALLASLTGGQPAPA